MGIHSGQGFASHFKVGRQTNRTQFGHGFAAACDRNVFAMHYAIQQL